MSWYKKAQNVTEHDLDCPECGGKLRLRDSQYGLYYRCENDCGVTHGAFKDGRPRGVPGDLETIALRKAAHNKFDELWKNEPDPKEARNKAYRWLASKMACPPHQCHMALFNKEQLRQVISICNYAFQQKKQREEDKSQMELF
jgi:ssDNA-binding Zn-finger/Zn-ribbon topoisomerase 1